MITRFPCVIILLHAFPQALEGLQEPAPLPARRSAEGSALSPPPGFAFPGPSGDRHVGAMSVPVKPHLQEENRRAPQQLTSASSRTPTLDQQRKSSEAVPDWRRGAESKGWGDTGDEYLEWGKQTAGRALLTAVGGGREDLAPRRDDGAVLGGRGILYLTPQAGGDPSGRSRGDQNQPTVGGPRPTVPSLLPSTPISNATKPHLHEGAEVSAGESPGYRYRSAAPVSLSATADPFYPAPKMWNHGFATTPEADPRPVSLPAYPPREAPLLRPPPSSVVYDDRYTTASYAAAGAPPQGAPPTPGQGGEPLGTQRQLVTPLQALAKDSPSVPAWTLWAPADCHETESDPWAPPGIEHVASAWAPAEPEPPTSAWAPARPEYPVLAWGAEQTKIPPQIGQQVEPKASSWAAVVVTPPRAAVDVELKERPPQRPSVPPGFSSRASSLGSTPARNEHLPVRYFSSLPCSGSCNGSYIGSYIGSWLCGAGTSQYRQNCPAWRKEIGCGRRIRGRRGGQWEGGWRFRVGS